MGRLADVSCMLMLACALSACEPEPVQTEADVIVIGAGIAGISAALEASDAGARVILLETSSVPGGHAVQAGGFALVGTPLQEKKGYVDTPELAYRDLMAWGEDADPNWVRQFTERARTDVHDWLTEFGVTFNILLDTPEDSVPRFHFAGGTAVNVIVPMLREAYGRPNLSLITNVRVEELIDAEGVIGIRHRHTRTGARVELRAPAVVLATGGFQSNLDIVRANWPAQLAVPEQLLIGSGHEATGDGLSLGRAFDVSLNRMDDQVTFINGLPNPREPKRGLHVTNSAAIWVDSTGRRFVNEAANSKQTDAAGLALAPQTHWLIFDTKGRRQLRLRGAPWLNAETITDEILDDRNITQTADTIEGLAVAAGLPGPALQDTISRYNEFVAAGQDEDFLRFVRPEDQATGQGSAEKAPALDTPPYFAMQLYPMTRKSLGGLAIDLQGRVRGSDGQPINGLFAAGELTGVAGINGSYGGSGTFLAPSVLTGRIAGASAVAYASTAITTTMPNASMQSDENSAATSAAVALPQTKEQLEARLATNRPGYWHFMESHAVVLDREYACTRCHSATWPMGPATTAEQRIAQLDTCTICH